MLLIDRRTMWFIFVAIFTDNFWYTVRTCSRQIITMQAFILELIRLWEVWVFIFILSIFLLLTFNIGLNFTFIEKIY